MITKKESALLDRLYRMGEELADFMKKNGYSREDFQMVSLNIGIDRVANGRKYNYISATTTNYNDDGRPYRIVSETINHITNKAEFREGCYKGE